MNLFYFNDCIPQHDNIASFTELLHFTVTEYNELLKAEIVERGIVTHIQASDCYYGNSFSLQQVIDGIPDKTMRDLAYSFFGRFPIGLPHFDDNDETLIVNSYKSQVNEEDFNAINLAIVAKNNGFLFTVPVNSKLRVDEISILENDTELKIPNLYGDRINTERINEIIKLRNRDKLETFERLIDFLGAKYSKQFKKEFEDLSQSSQILIIEHFEEAKSRNMPNPFGTDGALIKDVTPSKPKCDVFELRVFKERALRVYFNVSEKGMFISNIGFKNNNQQDQDIKQAHTILYKLILTS